MRVPFIMCLAGPSALALAASAPAQAQSLPNLITVNLQNVLNDLSVKLNIDRSNIPVTAQVPVQVAATVCGVNILSFSKGNTTCTATTAPQSLVQVVQQQMAAGGSATGGNTAGGTGGTTGTTGGTTGSTGGTTAGTGGTAGRNTGGATAGRNTGGGGSTTFANRGRCQSALVHMRNAERKASHQSAAVFNRSFNKTCQRQSLNGRRVYVIG